MIVFKVRKNFDPLSDKVYTKEAFTSLPEVNDCESLLIGCSHDFGGDYCLTSEADTISQAMEYIESKADVWGDYWSIECYTDIEGMPETTLDITRIKVIEQ